MKGKHARNSESRATLTKNSIVMCIMLVVLVLATLAWFTLSRYSEATDVYVGSDESENIMFAMPLSNGSYPTDEGSYFANLNYQEKIKSTYDIDFTTFKQEVTGDGIDFYVPNGFITENNVTSVDLSKGFRDAEGNYDYITIPFYVRTTTDIDAVYIDSETSYLDTGSAPLTATLADGTTDDTDVSQIKNKSVCGDFSVNAIAGGVRVSLLDKNDDLNFLWIPRPDLKLTLEGMSTWSLAKGVTEGDTYTHSYYRTDNGADFEFIENDENVITSKVNTKNVDKPPRLAEDIQVAAASNDPVATATIDGTEYNLYKFTINMWVEGSDSESVSPLNGGNFRLYLNFKS